MNESVVPMIIHKTIITSEIPHCSKADIVKSVVVNYVYVFSWSLSMMVVISNNASTSYR